MQAPRRLGRTTARSFPADPRRERLSNAIEFMHPTGRWGPINSRRGAGLGGVNAIARWDRPAHDFSGRAVGGRGLRSHATLQLSLSNSRGVLVKLRRLLEGRSHPEQRPLVERTADHLHPDWQPVAVEPA